MTSLSFVIGVQIVQVSLCIAAAALVSLTCLRKRPAWAAAIWLAVLCKCATPPVWASPLGVFSWLRAEKPRKPTELPSWVQLAPRNVPLPNPIVESPVVVAEAAPAPMIPWSAVWPWLLAGVWAAGFVAVFSRAFRQKRRWLAAVVEDCDPPPWIVDAVAERSRKLGMKPPRIVMVAADAGPAASGWLRPTVYLPLDAEALQLDAMLVHELVHLRRRDPWLGALQAFVCAAYWFHPGVRWASDELSRCIEEACDAETVRELGCKPVEYAAALVALLERRVAPSSVPLVAGMSPAKCVRRRLEAVMKTNPNRRGKPARGPWLAFAAATLIALPGAGLPSEPPKEQPKQVPAGEILPNPVAPVAVAGKLVGPPPKPVEIKNFSHRGYDLKPAVDVLVKRYGLREEAAANAVANMALAVAESIGPRPVFAMADQRLFAFAAEAQHEHMRDAIEGSIQVWSKDQVVIETEIWEVPRPALDFMRSGTRQHFENGRHIAETQVTNVTASDAKQPSNAPRAVQGATIAEGDLKDAICDAVFTEADYQAFAKRALSGKKANLLAAPRMITVDGTVAFMKAGREYPVGAVLKDGSRTKIHVGTILELQPTCNADGKSVTTKVRFEDSKLVRFVKPPAADGKESPEVPVTSQRVVETTFEAEWGKRIAIKTEPTKLLVFKCEKAPRSTNFNIEPPGDGRLQANKKPRMREAWEEFLFRMLADQPVVRVYPLGHLLRPNAGPRRSQLETLAATFEQAFDLPSKLRGRDGRGFQTAPSNENLVVNLPPNIHDMFARMLRDVDTRNETENLGIPLELRGTSPVGN